MIVRQFDLSLCCGNTSAATFFIIDGMSKAVLQLKPKSCSSVEMLQLTVSPLVYLYFFTSEVPDHHRIFTFVAFIAIISKDYQEVPACFLMQV